MAKTKNIEVIVAEKGKKEGEGGKDAAAPPKEGEVGGRLYARAVGYVPPLRCGAFCYGRRLVFWMDYMRQLRTEL